MRITQLSIYLGLVAAVLAIVGWSLLANPLRSVPQFEYDQVGEFELPSLAYPELLEFIDGRMYLGIAADGGGLHCYALPGHELLWSTELGTYYHLEPEFPQPATPYKIAMSTDGSRLFAGVSGKSTCTPHALRLVAIDPGTGEIVDQRETDLYYSGLYPCEIDGLKVLVCVGYYSILVLPQADLNTELASIDLLEGTGETGDPDNQDKMWLIRKSYFDGPLCSLYLTLPKTNELACYRFSNADGTIKHEERRVNAPKDAGDLLPLGSNELAVLGFESGEVSVFDRASLKLKRHHKVLPYARFGRDHDGSLLIVSNEGVRVFSERGRRVFAMGIAENEMVIGAIPVCDGKYFALFNEGTLDFIDREYDGATSISVTMSNGAIWLLDTVDWKLAGECRLPESCAFAKLEPRSGNVYMLQFNHGESEDRYDRTLKVISFDQLGFSH